MKQKIKIPDEIVKRVAIDFVDSFLYQWNKSCLKKCDVPSRKQLISKVIIEINNCPHIQEKLAYRIEEIISDIFVSDTIGTYDNKLWTLWTNHIYAKDASMEELLIQQVKDMGYEVKKKTNTKVRDVIK